MSVLTVLSILHMTSWTKAILVLLMLSFYGIQIWHTVYNEVNWPFSSHNFYYHRSPLIKGQFRIVLEDDAGRFLSVDPRHTLPIEGYRYGSIFRDVFVTNVGTEKKFAFSKLVLERLNQGGWKAFDERFPPVVPLKGHKFIGLSVEKHWIDTWGYRKAHELPLIKKEALYQYKEESIGWE